MLFGNAFLGSARFTGRLSPQMGFGGVGAAQRTQPINTPETWPARTHPVNDPEAAWTLPINTVMGQGVRLHNVPLRQR